MQSERIAADGMTSDGASDGRLLIIGAGGAGRTSVEALRPEDGLALWAYEPPRALSDIACDAGTVFVSLCVGHRRDPDEPARIVALRARDGAELWRTDPDRLERHLSRARLTHGVRVALAQFSLSAGRETADALRLAGRMSLAADGDVLAGSAGRVLFAFDAATGALRWMTPPRPGSRRRLFAAHGGRIYVEGGQFGLEALDARTGARCWADEQVGETLRITADEAYVYVFAHGRKGQVLVTLRVADGALVRTLPLRAGHGGGEDEQRLAGIADDGVAFLLHDRRLRAVRLTDGEDLWQSARLEGLRLDGERRPVGMVWAAADEHLIACAYGGSEGELHVVALDPRSGAPLWHWRGAERSSSAQGLGHLLSAFGNVYLSTDVGTYAFRGADGHPLWTMPAGFQVVRLAPTLAPDHPRRP